MESDYDKRVKVASIENGLEGYNIGLHEGDIIVSYADELVENIDSLISLISEHANDNLVKIKVLRGDEILSLQAKSGKLGITMLPVMEAKVKDRQNNTEHTQKSSESSKNELSPVVQKISDSIGKAIGWFLGWIIAIVMAGVLAALFKECT